MANEPKKIGGGLLELADDDRDFSHVQVFGALPAEALPTQDFVVAPPLVIKDQGDTDECTAYATCAASEDQEGVILDPHFTFYTTKVLVQKDPGSWGADLRSACKSHVDYGSLEEEFAPFAGDSFDRDMILSKDSWDDDHMMLAYEHRKTSYFNVLKGSPHDTFDAIRDALWKNRRKMQSVVTGAKWRPEWTVSEGGIIVPGTYGDAGEGHAFIFKGQKNIEGMPHLIAQLSNGTDIGDKGIFYMPREVANKELTFGAFSFNDMPRAVAENHIYYGTKADDSFPSRARRIIWRIVCDNFKLCV